MTITEIEKLKFDRKTVIYIDGYYIPEKEEFGGYKCILGEWSGDENDNDIFYYFESLEDLKCFMEVEGRIDTEFVITNIYQY